MLRAPLSRPSGLKVLASSQGPQPVFESGAPVASSSSPCPHKKCGVLVCHSPRDPEASGALESGNGLSSKVHGLIFCLVVRFPKKSV